MSVETILHLDGNEKSVSFERVQDVEDILDRNKALANESQKADTFHYVGEIPNVIIERWLNEEYARGNTSIRMGGEDFQRLCLRKLRDPDWSWLRTTSKRF